MFKTLRIAIVGAALAFVAVAGIAAIPSQAVAMDQGNPYLPTPIVADATPPMSVSDPAFCSVHLPLYACFGLDLYNGEGANKSGLPAREGKHHVAPTPPSKPGCDPKGDDTADNGGDGDGNGRGPGRGDGPGPGGQGGPGGRGPHNMRS